MSLELDENKEAEGLQRKSLREEIFDVLHGKIIAGEVHPGEWLRQDDIATQLGVSMTPVREALDLLVSVGLAERVPYRGVRVPQPSVEEMAEAYALRLLLESAGARAAASKRKQAHLDEMKRIITRTSELLSLNDMSTQRKLSRQFHQSIIAAGGNALIDRLYEMVMNSFPDWMLYENIFRHPELLESSLKSEFEEHAKMVEAIVAGDADMAAQRASNHVLTLGKQLVEFLGVPQALLDEKVKQFGLDAD